MALLTTRKSGSFRSISVLTASAVMLSAVGLSSSSPLYAQETLAGVGAATAIGGTLGAAAGTAITAGSATRNFRGAQNELIDEAGNEGNTPGGGRAPGAAGSAASSYVLPDVQSPSLSGNEIIRQLNGGTSRLAQRVRVRRVRSTRRSRYLARRERASKVLAKYKIPPVGWRAKYLAADRYKLGKVWRFVSTEDSRFYYSPQALAQRKFNPSRVIGFHSWQAAMLAGYAPDPISRPEPGAQILALSRQAHGKHFYQYVEYVYSGQVSPNQFSSTYDYALQVASSINRYSYARRYLSPTLDRVFLASITGDASVIPEYIGGEPRATVVSGPNMPQGVPPLGGVNSVSAPRPVGPGEPNLGAGSQDNRMDDFNRFGSRAGSLANVPANR